MFKKCIANIHLFLITLGYTHLFLLLLLPTSAYGNKQVDTAKAQFNGVWCTEPQRFSLRAARAAREVALLCLLHIEGVLSRPQPLPSIQSCSNRPTALSFSQSRTPHADDRGRCRHLGLSPFLGVPHRTMCSYHRR